MNEKPSDQFKAIPKEAPKPEASQSGVPKAEVSKVEMEKPARPQEFGGPTGPEPTRYGDWERNGRVSDF